MKEIIINSSEQKDKTIMLVENAELIECYEDKNNSNRLEGNIYLGKIQNVLPGMQAAFVDIGEKKNTFIHLKDMLPKVDVVKTNPEEVIKNTDIREIAKVGKEILVQVKRDSTAKKGARVSSHLNLPGRFLVLLPEVKFITVSQKIEEQEEKQRLVQITKKYLPKDCGAIIRTSAQGKAETVIREEIEELISLWNEITNKKEQIKAPALIYQTSSIIEKIIIDLIDFDIEHILVNDEKEQIEIQELLRKMNQTLKVEYKNQDLRNCYTLCTQLDKIENRKIWLKCGGFITIDKTEALTAIDVNSGKYTGTKDLEQTVVTVNKEASIEIAKQLRLRDIGGIIVIDYIDMKEKESKELIIEILKENLKKDRSKTQVIGFTELNLLEMTRKHMYSND